MDLSSPAPAEGRRAWSRGGGVGWGFSTGQRVILSMVSGVGWGGGGGRGGVGRFFTGQRVILSMLLGDSSGVVNSLDFCLASLKSLGCFYFRCVLSSQWKAVTVNLRILHCQL